MSKLVIAIIIILVIAGIGVTVYFTMDTDESSFENKDGKTPKESQVQQLTEEQILEITVFFDSNPNNNEIDIYCKENIMYCKYYCTQINPAHEYCEKMASQKNVSRGEKR